MRLQIIREQLMGNEVFELRRLRNYSKNRILYKDNRGSALLTVVLVVTFLTILATTLLYVSAMNLQIKRADYLNKKNFYTGETELERLRATLMQDVSKAALLAYEDVSMTWVAGASADVRTLQYNNAFVTRLQEEWDSDLAPYGGCWDLMVAAQSPGGYLSMKMDNDASGDGHLVSSEALFVDANQGEVRIQDIKVQYIDPSTRLTTIISTDFEVKAPAIDWSAEGSFKTIQTGDDTTSAATKELITPMGSIIYTDWKKE